MTVVFLEGKRSSQSLLSNMQTKTTRVTNVLLSILLLLFVLKHSLGAISFSLFSDAAAVFLEVCALHCLIFACSTNKKKHKHTQVKKKYKFNSPHLEVFHLQSVKETSSNA